MRSQSHPWEWLTPQQWLVLRMCLILSLALGNHAIDGSTQCGISKLQSRNDPETAKHGSLANLLFPTSYSLSSAAAC
ncbi:uncharacterized protein B0H64DRAFT_408919 [Chaetomium fimeti]|uniref:Secreted protein n=1 Tax=Chaetomium fimeti TaxID=1854472 RepID=A0AAE0H7J1_9PEZI|nr:hypothetical protein B0H64DRAFT_408919 [Chaetomium fimeti]